MSIPNQLTAGDSLRLSIPSQGRTAADGWAMALVLAPSAGGARLSASSSTADPDNASHHLLTVSTTATAAWPPGAYTWVLQVSKTGERITLASGQTTVRPDPSSGTAALDLRSVARKTLDAIDAYLSDPGNLAAASYSISGRDLSRWPRADLLAERDKWRAEVSREDAAARLAAGLGDRRRIYVRFGA